MGDAPLIPPAGRGAPWDIVFIDRDGTVNERVDGYVDDPDRLRLLDGAGEAIAHLNRVGCRVVMATNQRGLATGALTWPQWHAVTRRMEVLLANVDAHIDRIEMCPHEVDSCGCRKPAPGLFLAALKAAPWATPRRCAMVGDMPSDTAPALELGMRAILIGDEAASLEDAVAILLRSCR